MKHEIQIRIRVVSPVTGVAMQVQRGKNELLPPVDSTPDAVTFEFTVTVDLSAATPNFLGKYAQGPKDQRFVYVNSGTYAGQPGSSWQRRAKIKLTSVTREQIEKVIGKTGALLEAEIFGASRDGGPMCATVPILNGWRITGAKA